MSGHPSPAGQRWPEADITTTGERTVHTYAAWLPHHETDQWKQLSKRAETVYGLPRLIKSARYVAVHSQ
jgi:hypothetical protein